MANLYITMSGAKYHRQTETTVRDAVKFGADKLYVYDDRWLETKRPEVCAKVKYLFEHHATRGYGWFFWKALIILDALKRYAADGDVVMYVDGDTSPIADLRPLYDTCRRDGGIMLFEAIGCPNLWWTKRDVFVTMGMDEPKYWYSKHSVARFALFQKGGRFNVEEFLWKWFAYTINPFCNTFDPSVLGYPEHKDLHQNRTEQSVLSNLATFYGIHLYREACQYGNSVDAEKDLYPQVFFQQGQHSYDPATYDPKQPDLAGSTFRNVD